MSRLIASAVVGSAVLFAMSKQYDSNSEIWVVKSRLMEDGAE